MDYLIRVSGLALGLISAFFVASFYPVDEASKFFTAYAIGTLLSILVKLGMDDYVIKHNTSRHGSDSDLAKMKVKRVSINYLIICLTIMMLSLYAWKHPHTTFLKHVHIIMLACALAVSSISGAIYQSRKRFKSAALISSCLPQLTILLFLILGGQQPPHLLLYAGSMAILIFNAVLFVMYIKYMRHTKAYKFKPMLRESKIYLLSGAGTHALVHAPIALSGLLMSDEFTTDLAFSTRISQVLLITVALANFRLSPEIRSFFLASDHLGVIRTYKAYSSLTILALFFLSLAFCAFFIIFTNIPFFAESFRLPDPVIISLIWCGYLVNAACGPVSTTLTMIDKHKFVSLVSSMSLLLGLFSVTGSMLYGSNILAVFSVALSVGTAKIPLILLFNAYEKASLN